MKDPQPYHEAFPAGTTVRIADRASLENFMARWKYRHNLKPDQLAYADRTAKVKGVGAYHGGDMVYTLENIPGLWLEWCLREWRLRMKGLFEPAIVQEVKTRMAQLSPDSPRQWGKMTPAQMLAHCSAGMQMAVGDKTPPRIWIGRLLGSLAKKAMILKEKPMPHNSKTDNSLLVNDQRDFVAERQRLREIIDRFAAGGPAACTKHPHFFFGPLTPDEWAALMYQHLDHHLRQFQM